MPGFFFHLGAVAFCPHGAPVTTLPLNPRVFVSGTPVATAGDTFPAVGCPLASTSPEFCTRVDWLVPAQRVRASGQAVILRDSPAQCKSASGTVMGPPTVVNTQLRVRGT